MQPGSTSVGRSASTGPCDPATPVLRSALSLIERVFYSLEGRRRL